MKNDPRTNEGVQGFVQVRRMFERGVAVTVVFLLITSTAIAGAQQPGEVSSAEKLKAAFTSLKAHPNNKVVQQRYLKVFPHGYKAFLAMFATGGSLADGYECDYIFALSTLQGRHSTEVGSLLVQLSKDAEYQTDAPSCLQHVMTKYGSRYTKLFAGFLHQLSAQERGQLIAFLADVEVATYTEYQSIVQNLKNLKEPKLAKEFQQAQMERSRQSHG
jgi:hypothetical protein